MYILYLEYLEYTFFLYLVVLLTTFNIYKFYTHNGDDFPIKKNILVNISLGANIIYL